MDTVFTEEMFDWVRGGFIVIKNYANKVMDYEYNAFMTSMNVSVSKHLLDKHFTVLWANDYFYSLIGYEKSEYEALYHNHVDEYYKDDPDSINTNNRLRHIGLHGNKLVELRIPVLDISGDGFFRIFHNFAPFKRFFRCNYITLFVFWEQFLRLLFLPRSTRSGRIASRRTTPCSSSEAWQAPQLL